MIWGRLSLPVLALAGLWILLGHDALMAADPHRQPSVHAEGSDGHGAVEPACHLQEGVRTENAGVADPASSAAIHVLPEAARAPQRTHVVWMEPPGHPPDVLRALLQVFLN